MLGNRLATFMQTEKIISFRVFSSYDDDKDYTDLDKFHIDAAVFFDGRTFYVFTDVVNELIHKGYKTQVRPRKEMGAWIKALDHETTLVGFNSNKLQYQLLLKAYDIQFKTIDLMDSIGLAAASYYDTSKPRFTLRECSRWNSVKQSILPHYTWMFTTIELFDEWYSERFRSVAKNLAAECEMIAKLAHRIRKRKQVRWLDRVSGKGVAIPMDFYGQIIPRGFFKGTKDDPSLEGSE